MKANQYACTASEWYFVRVFMRIEEGSGSIDKLLARQTNKVFTPFVFFIITFITVILNAVLQALPDFLMKLALSYFLGAVIFGSIIAAIVTLKKAGSSYEKFVISTTNRPTTAEERVVLYETTNEGIYINYFNQTTREQMHFIDWDSIREMTIENMVYIYPESGHSMKAERFKGNIKEAFKQAENQLGYFPYEPKLSYSDVQAVFLKMGNQRYSELPIPLSWHHNGNYERFTSVLNDRLGND